jgi:hypothetical protein
MGEDMPYYYQLPSRTHKCDFGGKRGKRMVRMVTTMSAINFLADSSVTPVPGVILQSQMSVDLTGDFKRRHRWATAVENFPLVRYGRLGFVGLLGPGEAEITPNEFSRRLALFDGRFFGYLHRQELLRRDDVRSLLPKGKTVLFPGTRLFDGRDWLVPVCSRGMFCGTDRNWIVLPPPHCIARIVIAVAC